MEKLFEVHNDLFSIAERIKSIDANYKIYFNGDTHRYELHNERRKPTYQLTFPYPTLDKRAVDYALESGIKNRERILRQIEQHNKQLEEEHAKALFEKTMQSIEL